MVPLLNSYRYAEVVEAVRAAKRGLDPDAPVHLFGAGHPMMLALAVAAGCDLFDSAAYALMARDGRYLTVSGTEHLEDMEEYASPARVPSAPSTRPRSSEMDGRRGQRRPVRGAAPRRAQPPRHLRRATAREGRDPVRKPPSARRRPPRPRPPRCDARRVPGPPRSRRRTGADGPGLEGRVLLHLPRVGPPPRGQSTPRPALAARGPRPPSPHRVGRAVEPRLRRGVARETPVRSLPSRALRDVPAHRRGPRSGSTVRRRSRPPPRASRVSPSPTPTPNSRSATTTGCRARSTRFRTASRRKICGTSVAELRK